jgi:hypothetical protein
MFFSIVRQVQIDKNQPDKPDGDIQEEDESPMQVADDETASDWSKHRSNESWNRYEAHST